MTGVQTCALPISVHTALAAADRGEVTQPELDELDEVERKDEVQVAAGIGNTD